MERLSLHAVTRDAARAADETRAEGRVPAIIYGGGRKSSDALSLDNSEVLKVVRKASESTIIDVDVNGETVPALLGEIQRDPLTDLIIHMDLRQIDLSKPVRANIELQFSGEAPAVKTLGGTLVINKDWVEVRALPTALVDHITVDLGVLDSFEHSIHVRDIKLPDGVELEDDPQASVAVVRLIKEEVPEEVAPAADAAAVPTVAEEAKKEKEQKEKEVAEATK